jgi:hypothetical protein
VRCGCLVGWNTAYGDLRLSDTWRGADGPEIRWLFCWFVVAEWYLMSALTGSTPATWA